MPQPPRALVFDVFGTVVDWYGSVVRELLARHWPTDPGAFALAWRAGYAPAMDEVRSGRLPWAHIDDLHRRILDRLLSDHSIVLAEAEARALNLVWHRLDPWPDAVAGLWRLKGRFPIGTLSNGNVSLLVDLARHGGLPWDAIFSAELFGHYKPDPEVYLGAARLLGLAPEELMLVAAHPGDLDAAAHCGLQTAYVARPDEHGPGQGAPDVPAGRYGLAARDFVDLAARLGA
jgi:2-haloacid dehalogenase